MLSNFDGRMLLVWLVALFSQIGCDWKETLKAIGETHKETHFSWICGLTRYSLFVSTCTIIQKTYVIVSVDSLKYLDPYSHSKYYIEDIKSWRIHAGNEDSLQIRSPVNLYVPNVTDIKTPTNDFNIVKNPRNLDRIGLDVYGVALNLGLVEISAPFQWSRFVSPIPIGPRGTTVEEIKALLEAFRYLTEQDMMAQQPCVVGTWRKFSRKTLIATEVVYIPDQPCKEAYCINDRAACLRFPKFEYLMCYKSLLFMDLCPIDRGAALYCESFNKQVIGILTTAVNCGAKNLPSVYTSIEYVARFFREATGKDMERPPKTEDDVSDFKHPPISIFP